MRVDLVNLPKTSCSFNQLAKTLRSILSRALITKRKYFILLTEPPLHDRIQFPTGILEKIVSQYQSSRKRGNAALVRAATGANGCNNSDADDEGTEESNALNAKKPPSEVDLLIETRRRILPLFNELKFEQILCNK